MNLDFLTLSASTFTPPLGNNECNVLYGTQTQVWKKFCVPLNQFIVMMMYLRKALLI